jgi:hypothetical protein
MQHKPVILLALALLLSACASQKEATRTEGILTQSAVTPAPVAIRLIPPDHVARRLDSLAALSSGDYIHMQVSQCFGRCEGFVSIFRESPAKFHIYEGEAWGYNEFDRADVLYRLRRPITSDVAEGLIEKARTTGITKLLDDSTYQVTDQPYIWVRARIGGQTVAINHAYLGGKIYMDRGLNSTYVELRKLLLSPLYGITPPEKGGK